ncbi:MAG: cadherin-like domain-containing protein [Planctomycetales bacterium]|nr:cadherin-like domain-containing protein [Planctomycetales bacterium]
MKTDVLFAGRVDHADQVIIQSQSDHDALGRSLSANVSIGGALGAAVTSLKDTSSTTARLDGDANSPASVEQASLLKVAASSNSDLNATTGQGAIGGVAAAGVTVTKAVAEGTTQALVGDNVEVGQVNGTSVGSLVVDATATAQTNAQGLAIRAGIGAAGGLNFATADTSPEVVASLGREDVASNSHIKVADVVDVNAVSNSSSTSDMLGLQLAGGASLGFSRSRASVSPVVHAAVGRATSIEAGGDITIDAIHNRPLIINLPGGGTIVSEREALARAEAGAAAAIAGNTARAETESSAQVSAVVMDDSTISSPGLVRVLSESNNKGQAEGGAVTVGLASAGGVQTTVTIQGTSAAELRPGSAIDAGVVDVLSQVADRGLSSGRAATGGIVSGNGVTSSTSVVPAQRVGKFGFLEDVPSSSVTVSGATIQASGNVNVKASEQVDADAFAKGIAIGGVLTVGKSEANVVVRPLLDTLVTASSILATGNILVESRIGDGSNPSVLAMNIEEGDATANDEISLAFAKGSGGALIGVVGSEANNTFKPVADANVRHSDLTANNVTIQAEGDSSAAAVARNFSAGLVARGRAEADLDMKADLSADVSGTSESGGTTINAANNFNLRAESEQDGDAFSNTRAIAGFPTGRATTHINGDFDLSATIGEFVDVVAGNQVQVLAQAEQAEFGAERLLDPDDPTNVFGRPNYFGANANSDSGGISSDAFATASTLLGTAATPALATVNVGSFSTISAPTVSLTSDVVGVNLKSDASARSGGLFVDVSSIATGEVHAHTRTILSGDSFIDATSVNLAALSGSSNTGIRAQVESTTDKDGIDFNPVAVGTIRMDTDSTIDARDKAKIRTRNLSVLADANVSQFEIFVKENDTNRAGSGVITSSFERDRSIHWNADLVLAGAASPILVVEQDLAGNAVVTTANGVSIQDSDGTTIGPVAASTITVNAINNNSAFGNVSMTIPRRGNAADDTGVVDGHNGSVTIERAFEEVNLINRSTKPMTVNAVNVFNLGTPLIVVDAPDSSVLSFPVFQNFGDTHVNIENSIKNSTQPSLALNGVINNPVGDTTVKAGAIVKTGSGRIISNTADLRSTVGNMGSGTRLPVDLVISNGRQEDLVVNSAGSIGIELLARQRQPTGTPTPTVDLSTIHATTTNNILLHTAIVENSLPPALPLLRVNEIQEADITDVVSFFETSEEFINLDLGALGTGTLTPVASSWILGNVDGSAITIALDGTQITGPITNITASTDVGGSNINVSTNGDIELSERVGPMRIGAVTTTRGSVSLNSNSTIVAIPTDTAADVVGNAISLNAVSSIGTAAVPLDVDSSSHLNAHAGGDIVLVETSGNANVGQIASTNGNVSLTVTAGSIFDADADADADLIGNDITLTANSVNSNPAATIGTQSNAIEINSADSSAGAVRAIGRGDVVLVETEGSLGLMEVRSAVGNIRVDVPDTSGVGSDLTILSAAQIVAAGTVQLNAGDNLVSSPGSLVQGQLIGLVGDFGNADPGVGSSVSLAGTFVGRPISLSTGSDSDQVTLNQTAFQGQTNLNLGAGDDLLVLDRLAPLTTTLNGVRDTLAVNLGAGAHNVTVNSSPTGNLIANFTSTRSTAINSLSINDTIENDIIALNASQLAIGRAGVGLSETLLLGNNFDQIAVNASEGNDALAVDIAAGNIGFSGGVSFSGGTGTDQVSVNGSSQADTFEIDAHSPTSGSIRTRIGNGAFSAPILVTNTEQVGINGQNPTTNPGDRLVILDSLIGVPPANTGTINTPLPVAYTNIEQIAVGSVPVAVSDSFTIQEDAVSSFDLFANDIDLLDLPLTVSIIQPSLGTVVFNDSGTPNSTTDDRFVFTPLANVSGITSFQYTVIDANGDQSTATVQVVINPVVDAPIVAADNVAGDEGQMIRLGLKAALVDTDGSESMMVLLRGVPGIGALFNGQGKSVGTDQGDGVWDLTGLDLSDLFLNVRDNGSFQMTLEARSTEARQTATSSVTFLVDVGNVAPKTTIMSAPTDGTKEEAISVQMAATDPSSIDKASGFTYRIDWGDGSGIQVVQGQPGVPPTVEHIYLFDGIYTVTISATDKDGATGETTSHVIRIGQSGIVEDPLNPGETMLVLQGTDGDDYLTVQRKGNGNSGRLLVYTNEILTGVYPIPTTRLLVNALDGNDTVIIDQNVKTDAWIFGGFGNDILVGGGGNNVLLGGDGDDELRGRQGRDIIFGGNGADHIFGGSDENLLHAGTSAYDKREAALMAIQREWLSADDLALRVAHLRGAEVGGLNQGNFLLGSGTNQTAWDDNSQDVLDNHHKKDWVLANSDTAIVDLFGPTAEFEELDSALGRPETSVDGKTRFNYLDVDGNGLVTPLDALLIINQLNGRGELPNDGVANNLLDVSGDLRITPLDALLVINRLNSSAGTARADSEDNVSMEISQSPTTQFDMGEAESFNRRKSLLW